MSNVITRDDIEKGSTFVIKWANTPAQREGGVFNPGWKQQTEADYFLVHVDNQTSIINECRFIVMNSMQYDINYLRVRARLQYMNKLSGDEAGRQLTHDYTEDITETVPEFSRSSLNAVPFSAFTWTPKNFLLENIEKASFLQHMEQLLAESVGFSAESIGFYGIKKSSGATQDGMDHLDGIFKQALDIKTAYDTAKQSAEQSGKRFDVQSPRGYVDDISISNAIIPQMKKMLTQFSIQKGNRSRAKFYVSNLLYGLLCEEADARETEEGDKLYFKGGELMIWNTPITVAYFMDVPENDWGEQILLANPESITFGFLDQINSENTYEHKEKSYLSSVDVYFDVLILWNKDILVAKVIMSNSTGGGEGSP